MTFTRCEKKDHPDTLFFEFCDNIFWGISSSLKDIDKDGQKKKPRFNIEGGMNMFGWILYFVANEQRLCSRFDFISEKQMIERTLLKYFTNKWCCKFGSCLKCFQDNVLKGFEAVKKQLIDKTHNGNSVSSWADKNLFSV